MTYLTANKAFDLLSTLFELPKNATRIVITLEIDKLAVIDATTHAQTTDEPEPITERYILKRVEKEEAEVKVCCGGTVDDCIWGIENCPKEIE